MFVVGFLFHFCFYLGLLQLNGFSFDSWPILKFLSERFCLNQGGVSALLSGLFAGGTWFTAS